MKKVPRWMGSLFWENEGVNWEVDRRYMIERVLEMGNDKQVDWVIKNATSEEIEKVLVESKKISIKSANYWALYYKLDPNRVWGMIKPFQNRQDRFC